MGWKLGKDEGRKKAQWTEKSHVKYHCMFTAEHVCKIYYEAVCLSSIVIPSPIQHSARQGNIWGTEREGERQRESEWWVRDREEEQDRGRRGRRGRNSHSKTTKTIIVNIYVGNSKGT